MRRRLFLGGVAAALGAPALVARSSIMPVRPLAPPTGLTVTELDLLPWKVWHLGVDPARDCDFGAFALLEHDPRTNNLQLRSVRHYTADEVLAKRREAWRALREALDRGTIRMPGLWS